MWDYITVGEGERSTGAVLMYTIPGNDIISDSGNAFWISGCGTLLDCYLTIYKTSMEGVTLQKMINDGRPFSEMKRFIDEVIKEHITLPQMIERIEEIKKEAFKAGQDDRAREYRKLLNIR
jgi:hypothetical protein